MIRELNAGEVQECGPMGSAFYKRLGLPGKFNAFVFGNTWCKMIETGAGMILARFTEDSDRPVEAIGCAFYPDIYTGEPAAAQVFWFTLFDQDSLAVGLLHERLHETCAERGIKHMFMTALHNERFTKVSDFLVSRGYQLAEMVYRKAI